jgi:hypothetical protein
VRIAIDDLSMEIYARIADAMAGWWVWRWRLRVAGLFRCSSIRHNIALKPGSLSR